MSMHSTRRLRGMARLVPAALGVLLGLGAVAFASKSSTGLTISGAVPSPLEPGVTEPLDLVLTNRGLTEVSVSGIQVSVESVTSGAPANAHRCSLDDFSVAQFSGPDRFRLGPKSSSSLSELGFPPNQWPRLSMVARAANQDGCKGGSLSLRYSGTARAGTP